MRNKMIILFVAILSINFVMPFNKSYAVGVDTAVRIVAGSQAERNMIVFMENAGVRFANYKARKQALENVNHNIAKLKSNPEVSSQIKSRIDNFLDEIHTTNLPPSTTKPGFAEITFSAAAWLTGLDLVLDAYSSIKNAYDNQMYFNGLTNALSVGSYYESFYGYNVITVPSSNPDYVQLYADSLVYSIPLGAVFYRLKPYDYYFEYRFTASNNDIRAKMHTNYYYDDGNGHTVAESFVDFYWSSAPVNPENGGNPELHGYVERITPDDNSIPDISHVPPSFEPYEEPGIQTEVELQPEKMPDEVKIITPISPEDVPEPNETPINGVIIVPEGDTGTDPGTDPDNPLPPDDGSGTDSDTPTTKPDDTVNKFKNLVTTKFPFSLPWDLLAVVSVINAEPVAPVFEVDQQLEFMNIKVPFKFKHSIEWLDPYLPFFRSFITLGFILFLILVTRRLLGGAQ